MAVARRYFLVTTLLLGGLLCGSLTGMALASAGAGTIGTLPPHTPAADCTGWGLAAIDRCRAKEGVGALVLPTNWSKLSSDDKLAVLVDLERVSRGLPPIQVLVKSLNALAQAGAERGGDPGFPTCECFSGGGSIWATADPPSVIEADQLWMYDDAGSQWGHRDTILMSGAQLAGGAGATREDWTFEVLAGYRYPAASVTFRWSRELRYFTHKPGLDPRAG